VHHLTRPVYLDLFRGRKTTSYRASSAVWKNPGAEVEPQSLLVERSKSAQLFCFFERAFITHASCLLGDFFSPGNGIYISIESISCSCAGSDSVT